MKLVQSFRSLLFLFGQVVSAGLYSLFAVAIWPLRPVQRARLISGWAHFIIWWLRLTCNLGYRVEGLENLPQKPSVILSKHQSAWETIAFQVIFPPLAFILKRELFYIPLFGWGLAATSPIVINRERARAALASVTKQGKARLKEGRWIVIYPEGTRIAPGEQGEYKSGGALLASQAKALAIPVAHNAGSFWPKSGFLRKPGTITVAIGPAINTEGKKVRDITKEAEQWIQQTMARLES
ncbi:MAG TPA: lysophospholipid acyltransferase family protein [Arenicellales bacterium]|nr:lysophospholipid acyltransferase family protein [Arenicellales bacterium]HJL65365.1 lysophospholipid acyltransferase family protein [Arenicellales bacterium]